MRTVLYKDKFVEVFTDEIVIKTYFFPIATAKHISINELRCIYYRKQQCWGDVCITKGWGMTFTPIWWACDMRRHIHYGKNKQHFNVVLDSGTSIKQGFTVVDIHKFLKALRPLTNAPFEDHFPECFDCRPLPPPIGESSTSEGLLESDEKKNKEDKAAAAVFANKELPPSYDEAISSTKKQHFE
uniref:Uncharacterized protein n=1 Tax=Panagrolaimus sp. PS1159 TaxID=55785 RepID=A0AC35GNF2_9BILA